MASIHFRSPTRPQLPLLLLTLYSLMALASNACEDSGHSATSKATPSGELLYVVRSVETNGPTETMMSVDLTTGETQRVTENSGPGIYPRQPDANFALFSRATSRW